MNTDVENARSAFGVRDLQVPPLLAQRAFGAVDLAGTFTKELNHGEHGACPPEAGSQGELRGRVLRFDGWVRQAPKGTPKSRTPPCQHPVERKGCWREMPQFWGAFRGLRHSLPYPKPMPSAWQAPCFFLRALQRACERVVYWVADEICVRDIYFAGLNWESVPRPLAAL
jgi:hypothetical protein